MKEDLLYLNEHCKRIKSIKDKINNLRQYSISVLSLNSKSIEGFKFLRTVEYCDLNNWDISCQSKSINILIVKLIYMIDKGDIINIYPLLNRIVNVGIKKQTRPAYDGYKAMFLGHGHFRLSETMFILTPDEIKIIKEYFEL